MSRTDKTKPLWVRHIEHAPQPIHDHRFGPCDLPPAPTRDPSDTHCHWRPGTHFYSGTCCSGCNIRGCIKERQAMNTTANRKSRHQARAEARRYNPDEN
jgi:hypothetical protein